MIISLTLNGLCEVVKKTVNEVIRVSKESGPFNIGGSGHPALDITDFVNHDEELSEIIDDFNMGRIRAILRGSACILGKSPSDVVITSYKLSFIGSDDKEGLAELSKKIEEKINSPHFLERWELLVMIRNYINRYYKIKNGSTSQ